MNANAWVGTGSEPLSPSTLFAPSAPTYLQPPQCWYNPAKVSRQPSPPPGASFHPGPPSHCYRIPRLVAVPRVVILSYPASSRNDFLLALTPAPPPPASPADVDTPVRQFAVCCSCPLSLPLLRCLPLDWELLAQRASSSPPGKQAARSG